MSVSTISLVSNSSMNFFPDNTSSHFSCQFPEELYYNDAIYEIALVSFQCNKSWYSLRDDEVYSIDFFIGNPNYTEDEIKSAEHNSTIMQLIDKIVIPSGVYENESELVEKLKKIYTEESIFRFEYDSMTKKITIEILGTENYWYKICMSKDLARKLGFQNYPVDSEDHIYVHSKANQTITAKHTVRLNELDQIFVTCDLAENLHIVGDIKTPLLHIIPVSGKFNDIINFEPKTLIWLPLKKNSFTTSEVYITDAQGRNVPFSSGISIVRVNIRRKNLFR